MNSTINKIVLITDTFQWSFDGYKLLQCSVIDKSEKYIGQILDKYSYLSKITFTRRLLRAEITGLYLLENKSMIAIAKKGLFRCPPNGGDFYKVLSIYRGSKPLNLCILPNGHIFWGEYFQNVDKESVHIYGSVDNGQTWNIVYTFPTGGINHVHGVFEDTYTGWIWVLTGDRENECIIGYSEDEFQSFREVFRGGQEYRSCQLFFYKDFIVYATDSQYIENEIRAINRKTLEITTLVKIQGSAIKGGQTGDVSYLSTTIEPSDVNKDKYSHIWITKDGKNWEDVYKAKKDNWPSIFQFGTFEFPQNAYCNGKLWFSGRALKGFDGKSTCIEI
ncbi:hypothetical protein [Parabacteroides gordonii]|uniref:hypothetical protein n=1 Tax=Parabacteroides gordonii TaxID=574930 RepID=UPI0026EB93A6|nr:hypothetical protein [Parabacteroides gordonii]